MYLGAIAAGSVTTGIIYAFLKQRQPQPVAATNQ